MIALRKLLPSLVTAITLSCGLLALEAIRTGSWDWALRLIILAAVADALDGVLARQLRATSALGQQFDSLADIVAFGAAPAFLFATYLATAPEVIRFGGSLAFLLAGAYRLARFHVQPSGGAFRGLPITAAGVLLTMAVAGPFHLDRTALVVTPLALAALMVCNQPFPKVVWSGPLLVASIVVAIVGVLVSRRIEAIAILGGIGCLAYLAWGLLGGPVPEWLGRSHHAAPLPGKRRVHEPGRPIP